jgi:hypothetical protein
MTEDYSGFVANFEASIEIRAPSGEIFALTHDYDRRLEWDTLLKEARLLDGATRAGLGVKSICVGKNRLFGMGVETVYIRFDPPDAAAVEMTGGPRLFETFAASILHEPAGLGFTRVTYRGHVKTRPRWLRWLVEPIVAASFRRETRKRLEALKRACE